MPYEIINRPDDEDATRFSLHWHGESQNLQLAVSLPMENLREIVRMYQDGKLDVPEGGISIYSNVLSRSEVQGLIRNARRARNAVYGADE